jgi:hypothetical protein
MIVGVAPYPLCRKCGRLALRCRNCRHYCGPMTECQDPRLPEPRRITDPDRFLSCCQLPLSPAGRAARSPVTVALLGGVLLALGLWAFTVVYTGLAHQPAPALFMRIPPGPQISLDETCDLRIIVFNPSRVTARRVTLVVERSYLEHFDLAYTQPVPMVEQRQAAVVLQYGDLPSGRDLQVQLELKPKEAGDWRGRFVLFSDGALRHKTITVSTQVSR